MRRVGLSVSLGGSVLSVDLPILNELSPALDVESAELLKLTFCISLEQCTHLHIRSESCIFLRLHHCELALQHFNMLLKNKDLWRCDGEWILLLWACYQFLGLDGSMFLTDRRCPLMNLRLLLLLE